jgi:carbon storage regulator
MIWDNVEITVVGIRENQVKLGITAPREIPVHRREVFDRIRESDGALGGPAEAAEGTPEHDTGAPLQPSDPPSEPGNSR